MKKLLLLLALAGCAGPAPAIERDFTIDGARYKVTREETSDGPGDWLLWREEGISWRLVAQKPGS